MLPEHRTLEQTSWILDKGIPKLTEECEVETIEAEVEVNTVLHAQFNCLSPVKADNPYINQDTDPQLVK